MWLKLRCVELDKKELEELDVEPIDLQLYNEDSEAMLEWVEATKNQEDPLLDEAGDSQRPSYFIIETIKEEAHLQQVEDPPQSEHGRSSHSTSETQLSQSSAQRAKAKKKGKAVASATPLERIESGDEAPSQSIQGHDTNTDNSSSTDNGSDAGSRIYRLHKSRVVHGPRSSILHMTHKTQIMEFDKVLVMFIRGREKGRRRRRQWMNLSICDRAYRIFTQNKAHRIHNHRIMENLMANNSTVIVGHSSPINNMIQSNRSIVKVEALTFTNICLGSHLEYV
ncbi:hypothetical protein GW17_00054398 [Ensete ventricosum]|nr:hypothetical protein GW17_00054398 [Ensete ventricosum]